MKLFSEREGFKPVKSIIQLESIDDELKNGLWNCLYNHYLHDIPIAQKLNNGQLILETKWKNRGLNILSLTESIWMDYFKNPIDEFRLRNISNKIKGYFFTCEWYNVYSLLEFVINNYEDYNVNQKFMQRCNIVLERELSGYRFIDGQITEITSEEEINEIEEAIEESPNPVSIHLKKSLELLSDRKSPDYSNSIKESISAVESIGKLITGESLSLGQSLNKIENNGIIQLHPALKEGFTKIYGYTSDSDGIRHGLSEEPNLDYEDAKFMLVSCSAFTNYLIAKAAKHGIKFE